MSAIQLIDQIPLFGGPQNSCVKSSLSTSKVCIEINGTPLTHIGERETQFPLFFLRFPASIFLPDGSRCQVSLTADSLIYFQATCGPATTGVSGDLTPTVSLCPRLAVTGSINGYGDYPCLFHSIPSWNLSKYGTRATSEVTCLPFDHEALSLIRIRLTSSESCPCYECNPSFRDRPVASPLKTLLFEVTRLVPQGWPSVSLLCSSLTSRYMS